MKKLRESISEGWIRLSIYADKKLEKYWFNVLLSIAIIATWSLFVTLILHHTDDPFASLIWLYEREKVAAVIFVAFAVGLGTFYRSKGKKTANQTSILLIIWLLVMGCVYGELYYLESSAAAKGGSNEVFFIHLWRSHTWWLGGWYSVVACQTLLWIFRGGRAKLRHYWSLFLSGFILLAIGYGLSSPLAFLVALIVPHEFFNRWLKAASEKDSVQRGIKVLTTKEAKWDSRKKLGGKSLRAAYTYELGGVTRPVSDLTTHFVAIGSAGSGKSITSKLIAQTCLPMVIPDTPLRAIYFDPKHNAYTDILGMYPISADVVICNAFDRRSARYDLAVDFTTLAHAQALGSILIPEPQGGEKGDRFFHLAASNLLTGIAFLFMIKAPDQWRLSDLVRAFDSEAVVRALLGSHPETKVYLTSLGTDKTAANILSSALAEINRYRAIAALWEHSSSVFSIKDWQAGGKILILGEAEEARPAMNALNTLVLTRMGQLLLQEDDHLDPRTFIFLDELQSIYIPILEELATKGRSKGICLIAAFQSIQGLYKKYGKEAAESMLGQFRQKAFLKCSDVETAEWISKTIADNEVKRQNMSTVWKEGSGRVITWSERTGGNQTIQQVRAVLPTELLHIPAINPPTNQGLTGFYQLDKLHKHYEPWDKLIAKLQPRDDYSTDFDPAPADWQRLQPWTEDDWERLGITDVMRQVSQTDKLLPFSTPMEIENDIQPL